MAKRSTNQDGINKSAAIRELLDKDPHIRVRDIVSTLGDRGISVHPNLVYLIRGKVRAKRGKARREKALAHSREMGLANPVELVLAVRQLALQAGGIRHLKQLVDVLAE